MLLRTTSGAIGDPPSIELRGLPPGSCVALHAACVDPEGHTFQSRMEFVADARGHVDSTLHAPVAGSFRELDASGPWWSMCASPARSFAHGLRAIPTRVSATLDGATLGRVEFERRRIAPEVSVLAIRDAGLVGTLFTPPTAPARGVLVLGGSEGGVAPAEEVAAFLASHGVVALALAYFGTDGLPGQLAEIPVEYVEGAAAWLWHRPEVSGAGIGVVGASRGGELALLAASSCSLIRVVVGIAASPVLWPGRVDPSQRTAAWSRRGAALPFVTPKLRAMQREAGIWRLEPAFRLALAADPRVSDACVPLHAIGAAVLLISGGDDGLWPSSLLARLALRGLGGTPSGALCQHLDYPGAGHAVARIPGPPASPLLSPPVAGGPCFALGGSRRGNAHSARDAWPRIVSFINHHLGSGRAARTSACRRSAGA